MTIKDCFGDGLVDGSKLLLFGREYSLLEIEHLEGNVYGVTVDSGIEGDDTSYVKVSAEHEVLVPAVKAKSESEPGKEPKNKNKTPAELKKEAAAKKEPDPFDIVLDGDDKDKPKMASKEKGKSK